MSDYLEQIKYYRSITGFITSIEEAMYVMQINDFFKWMNMKKSYKKQILNHNVEKFSLRVKDNIDIFSSTKTLAEANKNAILNINSVIGAKSITEDLNSMLKKISI